MLWAVVPATHARPPACSATPIKPEGANQIECGVRVGPRMVAHLCAPMERSLVPPSLFTLAKSGAVIRCSGLMGVRGMAPELLVQLQWDVRSSGLSIAEKELIPIVLARLNAAWGSARQGHQVFCHCDNQVVVTWLQSRKSKHKGVTHLLRCFMFVEAHFGFYLYPSYIDTKGNHLPNDLSRNNLCSFLSKVPTADCHLVAVFLPLLDLLLDPQADSTSPSWHHQFKMA